MEACSKQQQEDRKPCASSKRPKMDVAKDEEKVKEIIADIVAKRNLNPQDKWIDTIFRALSIAASFEKEVETIAGMVAIFHNMMSNNETANIDLRGLSKNILCALSPTSTTTSSGQFGVENFLNANTAEQAFKSLYVSHGGEDAFWKHVEDQKKGYVEKPGEKYPFFSIIQSSGYGKSRLLHQLGTTDTAGKHRMIYLSFAATGAYPASNVEFQEIELKGRGVVEKAFTRLFEDARLSSEEAFSVPLSFTVRVPDNEHAFRTAIQDDDCIFVLDEVSQLLSKHANNEVDFFRCLRKATKTYVEYRSNSFFVLLSTYSSVNQLMPGRYFDPSSKVLPGSEGEILEPMAPFLLHHAIAVRNRQTEILEQEVATCHKPLNLLAMGRPLWHALLNTTSSSESEMNERASELLNFALAKLLQQHPVPSQAKLTSQQLLALLACRACLTISPVSRFAPAMVASHMGTAVRISTERDEVVVSYPSEPILALASRYYVATQNKNTLLRQIFVQLKEYFASGAVAKGHRGEVIVRLLNLLAMDACMSGEPLPYKVSEVCLVEFLKQFDRDGASLSEHLKSSNRNVKLSEKQIKMLKREGILDSAKDDDNEGGSGFYSDILKNGKVCFTHFIYLSDDAMITPNLLRYAYRRTAAIVVNAGRRGIDWIIPVRLGDEDSFVGLAGQDKNRMRATLPALTALSNETTHHKVTASYFLNSEEKLLFQKEDWSLNWPAILFSIGTEEVGAALADQAIRRRLRGDGVVEEIRFPCIVLTSLGYSNLMDNAANVALQQLRDFVNEPPPVYKETVPLTFGVRNPTTSNDLPSDKMDCT